MNGVVVIDTNLLVLLIVGSASREFVARHKRLQGFTLDDFDLLNVIIAQFSDIILLPHVLSEVSNIARQMAYPALSHVQSAFRRLVRGSTEVPIPSALGCERNEFARLGLTDAVIMHFCSLRLNGVQPTLLTADTALANNALSLGYSVIDYRQQFQSE
jgi:hypothetical protein